MATGQAPGGIPPLSPEREASLRELWDRVNEAITRSQHSWDHTVLLLSGGALGLSLSFVGEFVEPTEAEVVLALFGAWILWAVSLIAVLFSFVASNQSQIRYMSAIDKVIKGKLADGRHRDFGQFLEGVTGALNWIAAVAFPAGVVLIVVFAIGNWE